MNCAWIGGLSRDSLELHNPSSILVIVEDWICIVMVAPECVAIDGASSERPETVCSFSDRGSLNCRGLCQVVAIRDCTELSLDCMDCVRIAADSGLAIALQSRKLAHNSQNAVAIENRKIKDSMGIARFQEDHLSTIFPYKIL